jgi:hypothetical protein
MRTNVVVMIVTLFESASHLRRHFVVLRLGLIQNGVWRVMTMVVVTVSWNLEISLKDI